MSNLLEMRVLTADNAASFFAKARDVVVLNQGVLNPVATAEFGAAPRSTEMGLWDAFPVAEPETTGLANGSNCEDVCGITRR